MPGRQAAMAAVNMVTPSPSSSSALVYMNFAITELGVIIGCAIMKLKQVITMPNELSNGGQARKQT